MASNYGKTSLKKRSSCEESRSFEQYFTNKRANELNEEDSSLKYKDKFTSQLTPQPSHNRHFADAMDCAEANIPLPPASMSQHYSFSPIPPVSPYRDFGLPMFTNGQEKSENKTSLIPPTQSSSNSLFDTLMTHSRETARQQRDSKPSAIVCWQCQTTPKSSTRCSICMRPCCKPKCVRSCEACTTVVCSLCSEVDYTLQFDRLLCVSCIQSCNDQSAMDY